VYNVAFFFHILGVLLFVSGIVLAGAAFEAALAGSGRRTWRCCWV
jgi:hypothetical protein